MASSRSSELHLYAVEDKVDDNYKFSMTNAQALFLLAAQQDMKFDAPNYVFADSGQTSFNLESRFDALETDQGVSNNAGAIASLQTALADELVARQGADTTNANAITAETSARVAADDSASSARGAEATARSDGDGVLDTKIDTEISDRTTAVSAEAAARVAAVTGIQTQITNILSNATPGSLDSLAEIVAAFESADSTLTGTLSSISAKVDALEAVVNDLVNAGL
jgi:hypothetical protein